MANIKSAKKRIKVIEKKTAQNNRRRSMMKTAERRFMEALESGDKELAKEKFAYAQKIITQAAYKNVIHKNCASRKIAKLARRLNA